MAEDRRNVLVDLVDLRTRVTRLEADAAVWRLHAELRVRPGQVTYGRRETSLSVAFRGMTARLETAGCEVKLGSIQYDPVRGDEQVRTTSTTESASGGKFNLGGAGKLDEKGTPNGSLTVDATYGRSRARNTKSETSREEILRCVTAGPGDRWAVRDPQRKHLEGTYLNHERHMCDLEPTKGANRKSTVTTVEAAQRDVTVEATGKLARMSTTKRRLMAIFVAKVLSEEGAAAYRGKLTLSTSEYEVED